jgi:hypothetical protein
MLFSRLTYVSFSIGTILTLGIKVNSETSLVTLWLTILPLFTITYDYNTEQIHIVLHCAMQIFNGTFLTHFTLKHILFIGTNQYVTCQNIKMSN